MLIIFFALWALSCAEPSADVSYYVHELVGIDSDVCGSGNFGKACRTVHAALQRVPIGTYSQYDILIQVNASDGNLPIANKNVEVRAAYDRISLRGVTSIGKPLLSVTGGGKLQITNIVLLHHTPNVAYPLITVDSSCELILYDCSLETSKISSDDQYTQPFIRANGGRLKLSYIAVPKISFISCAAIETSGATRLDGFTLEYSTFRGVTRGSGDGSSLSIELNPQAHAQIMNTSFLGENIVSSNKITSKYSNLDCNPKTSAVHITGGTVGIQRSSFKGLSEGGLGLDETNATIDSDTVFDHNNPAQPNYPSLRRNIRCGRGTIL
ncbi:MAG: hypothetical protein EZS28_034258, partial [Streblomastix strix]